MGRKRKTVEAPKIEKNLPIKKRKFSFVKELDELDKFLRPHQTTCVQWGKEREKDACVKGGCIFSEPGTGKTLILIKIIIDDLIQCPTHKTLLILRVGCFDSWTQDLSLASDLLGKKYEMKPMKETTRSPILWTTPEYYRENVDLFRKLKFRRLVIDEADFLRNGEQTRTYDAIHDIQAEARWLMTGTPFHITQANVRHLFDLLHADETKGTIQPWENYVKRDRKDDLAKTDAFMKIPDKVRKVIPVAFSPEEKEEYLALFKQTVNVARTGQQGMFLKMISEVRQYASINESKADVIEKLIDKHPDENFIIFSTYTFSLIRLREVLYTDQSEYIDGSYNQKQRSVALKNARENPKIRVFYLSLLAAGISLNLTKFTRVIFLEPSHDPQNELQGMQRTHRIGQHKVVTVYWPLMENTMEERIYHISRIREAVSNEVLGDDTDTKKFNFERDDITFRRISFCEHYQNYNADAPGEDFFTITD
jgi:SNF2 family DNA or RNA helicase